MGNDTAIVTVGDFVESLGFPLTMVAELQQALIRQETFNATRAHFLANRGVGAIPESRALEGIGEHIARVPLGSYLYWNQREPEAWTDKGFKEEFLRDNPGCRVKYRPDKFQLGWRDSLEQAS